VGPLELAILIAGLGVAGLAKGISGMGLPLIATPILAGVFGPRAAVTIVTIPIFVANTLLVVQGYRGRPPLRELAPFVLASVVGTAIGTLLLVLLDQRTFAILISAMVAVFLARGDRLMGDDPAALRARIIGPAVCFVGGILQGTTSIASPLVGSYFHARRLAPAQFVFVLATLFELNSAVQLVGYSLQGLYTSDIVALGIVGLIPTLIAMIAGIWLRGKLDAVVFRRFIVVLVVLSVANLLWRTFLG
jgi:uncharacterized membrane protein YfcA